MTEESPVKCSACRCILINPLEHGLIDAHSQQLHNSSLPYDECPSLLDHSRLFLDHENLPEFVHQSVIQTGFTVGRLKCLKCGAKLGAFNFIKGSRCSCGMHSLPPVHFTLSKVDYPECAAALAARKRVTVGSTDESAHSSEEDSSGPLLQAWSSEQQAPLVGLLSASDRFDSFFTHQGSPVLDVSNESCCPTYDSLSSNPEESLTGSSRTQKNNSGEWCSLSAEGDLESNLLDYSTKSKSDHNLKSNSCFSHQRLPQPCFSSSLGTSSTTSCKYLELDSDALSNKSSELGDILSLTLVATDNDDHSMPDDKATVDTLTASGLSDVGVPCVDFVTGRGVRSSNASIHEKYPGRSSRCPTTNATSGPLTSRTMSSHSSPSNDTDVVPSSSTAGPLHQEEFGVPCHVTETKGKSSAGSASGDIDTARVTNDVEMNDSSNSNSDPDAKSNKNCTCTANSRDSETSSSNSADVLPSSAPTTSHDNTVPNDAVTPDAELLDYPDHLVCPICLELLFSPFTVKPCGHIYCEPCLRRLARPSPTNTACPLCREIIGACQPAAECTREVRQKYPKQVAERHKFEQNNSAQHLPLPWLQSYRFLNFDSGTRHPRSGVYSRYSNWWRTALWIFWVDAIGFLLILTLNWFLSQTIQGADPQRLPSAHHLPPKSDGMPSHILLDGSGDGGLTSSKQRPYSRKGDGMGRESEWPRYAGSGDGDDMDTRVMVGGIVASTDYLKYKKFHSPHTVSPIQTTTYAPSIEDSYTNRPDNWKTNSLGMNRADEEMRVENYERMIQDLYNRFDKFNNPFVDAAVDVDGDSANYNVISKRQSRSKRGARMGKHPAFRNAKFKGDSLDGGHRADGADEVPRSSREGVRWWLA